ncbi:hypothetical protein M9H77_03370 [Catharanthus roseus]|uniref:Uncharacterized protein n=1 Tax=Catharanthus roseus TaxID=4058 RepID=A0ACC0CB77_CATRO|nr:hypothetical protein M9H77_03370 [Catharanthus roseus]
MSLNLFLSLHSLTNPRRINILKSTKCSWFLTKKNIIWVRVYPDPTLDPGESGLGPEILYLEDMCLGLGPNFTIRAWVWVWDTLKDPFTVLVLSYNTSVSKHFSLAIAMAVTTFSISSQTRRSIREIEGRRKRKHGRSSPEVAREGEMREEKKKWN